MPDLDRWVVRPRRRADPELRLVCVPFAGAGTGIYHGWADLLPEPVEAWLLRPPGRETRLREPACRDLAELVDAVAPVLAAAATGPVAVFGHSLGAAVGFELARALGERHGVAVRHVLVSGLPAPHLPRRPPIAHLPARAFLDALAERYQQVPDALRDDPEMQAMYLPVLRADVAMYESYQPAPGRPLDCPLTVLGGAADRDCPPAALDAWRPYTTAEFGVTLLPGGHFNFNTEGERTAMVGAIARALPTAVPS